MEFEDCVKFAKENPITCIATVEENQRRARAFGMWFADSTGFYYQTSTMKSIIRQLKENPKIELCFVKPGAWRRRWNPVESNWRSRISRRFKPKEKNNARQTVSKKRDLRGLSPESPTLIIFRVAKGEAHFWTMETNLKPKQIIKFG